jgi:SNF family Na+-dependent transporter
LQKSESIEEPKGLIWQLVLSLIGAWFITFCLIAKGVEGTGKIVYVTTTFPYIILFILGVQGWTLDGASVGIKYYLTPNMARLTDIEVIIFF